MKILIWGVSCVGKTTVGSLLAKKLNYKFIDLNDEIKKRYKQKYLEWCKNNKTEPRFMN